MGPYLYYKSIICSPASLWGGERQSGRNSGTQTDPVDLTSFNVHPYAPIPYILQDFQLQRVS